MSEFTGIRWKQKPLYTIDGEERKLDGADIMPLTHAPWVDGEEADGSITMDSLAEAMHTNVAALREKTEFSKDGTVVSIEDGKAYKGSLGNMMAAKFPLLNSESVKADMADIGELCVGEKISVKGGASFCCGSFSCGADIGGTLNAFSDVSVAKDLHVKGDIYQNNGLKISENYIHCSQNPVLSAEITESDEVQSLDVVYADSTSKSYEIDSRAVLECASLPVSACSKVYNVADSSVVCTCEEIQRLVFSEDLASVCVPDGFTLSCLCVGTDADGCEVTVCSVSPSDKSHIFMCGAEGSLEPLGADTVCAVMSGGVFKCAVYGDVSVAADCVNADPQIAFACIKETTVRGDARVWSKDVELVTKREFSALSVSCIHNEDCSVCVATLSDSVQTRGNVSIAGDLVVNGAVYQCGSTYVTHAEDMCINDNDITLRANAESGLADSTSGLKVAKYDGTNTFELAVDASGTARAGDTGDLKPMALRDEEASMADGCPVVWDASGKILRTSAYPVLCYYTEDTAAGCVSVCAPLVNFTSCADGCGWVKAGLDSCDSLLNKGFFVCAADGALCSCMIICATGALAQINMTNMKIDRCSVRMTNENGDCIVVGTGIECLGILASSSMCVCLESGCQHVALDSCRVSISQGEGAVDLYPASVTLENRAACVNAPSGDIAISTCCCSLCLCAGCLFRFNGCPVAWVSSFDSSKGILCLCGN